MPRLLALILVTTAWAQAPSPTLLERLGSDDPVDRLQAMDEVRRQPEEVRLALARALAEAPPEVAMRLWRALAVEVSREPAVIAIALRAAGPDAREEWIRAAREAGVEHFLALSPPLPADLLVQLLSPTAAVEVRNLTRPARPRMRPPPPEIDAVVRLARHESHVVRAAVAQWLSDVSGAQARRCIESLCEDPSGLVRLTAMRALAPRFAERRDQRSFLVSFLSDPSPALRADALSRIAPVASPATDLAAWVRLWDPDAEVRHAAASYFAIRRLPWALPYMMRAMASSPDQATAHIEHLLVAERRPRELLELAERLHVVPRSALPVALRILEDGSRAISLPGPAWISFGDGVTAPATLDWEGDTGVAGIRVGTAGPIQMRVLVTSDGRAWTDLGVFVVPKGDCVLPIGGGWRRARLAPLRSSDSRLPGPWAAATTPAQLATARCWPLRGPADAVEAWRAWAQASRPWITDDAETALERAARLRDEGKRIDALTELTALLQRRPDHLVARLWKAELLVEGSAFDDAARVLEQLVQEHPGYAPALGLLARVREVKEDFAGARTLLGRAIEADPADVSYRARRAKLATRAQEHHAAAEDLAVALALRPEDPILRFDYGFALFTAGRYEEGLAQFRRVLERDPGNLDARYNIACGLARLGRAEDALEALADAVRAGYRDAEFARKDPDLESIRADPRFEAALRGASDPKAALEDVR